MIWELVETEIGWVRNLNQLCTIRNGWAIKESDHGITVWIEGKYLAVHDPTDYYPTGCYDIPLELIELLKNKENTNE